MAFAVIESGGKQYRVSPGALVTLEKLEAKPGETVTFERVLMYQTEAVPVVGTPLVEEARVTAEVVGHIKGPKLRVFTYKPKKRQRRTLGHRQELTQVRVTEIKTSKPSKEK